MRPLILLLALLCLTACQNLPRSGAAEVDLSTDQSAYVAGAEVQLRLVNDTEQTVGYNLCTATLERETGGGWQPAGPPETCTAIQHGLAPGDSASYAKRLPGDLPDGRYRFVADVEYRSTGDRLQHMTDAFDVAG